MKYKKGICKKCETEQYIVNKFHYLCIKCNNERLHNNPYGKQYEYQKELSEKAIETIRLDEECYEKVFNLSDHKCKECGKPLPKIFRGDDGKVIARYRYAHIIAKSLEPKLRHDVENFVDLCLEHHIQLDHGDKKGMKIWTWIEERIEYLRNKTV